MQKHYSVTEAAKKLGRDKSIISRHISKINDTLSIMGQVHRLLTEGDLAKIDSSLQRTTAEYPNSRRKVGKK